MDLYVNNAGYLEEYKGRPNRLLRNNGDETFSNQTAAAGLDFLLNPNLGGFVGAMTTGDFNNDGWPDLYMGVLLQPNRLFLNDGQGHFFDATTDEIGDRGEAFSTAIGDIDNDGDLDIFQAAGGFGDPLFRSLMLLNLGAGLFLDVTEGIGLTGLGGNTEGTSFADIDNDGDLDLIIGMSVKESGRVNFLFLNDGNGNFVDRTALSGIGMEDVAFRLALGDYDEDGSVDLLFASLLRRVNALYRNNGMSQTADGAAVERHAHHWLRVELVGTQSNRSGIGARLTATSGDLEQMREVAGGLGRQQDEKVAHFGLGERIQVDRLEIRWPSAQVDVLTDISADQKIRVFEGSPGYHVVRPSRWVALPLDTLIADTLTTLRLAVQPALFSADATPTSVVADLSSLGGAEAVPLEEGGDGIWSLDAEIEVGSSGLHTVFVMIDQETFMGPHWIQMSRQIAVLPAADLSLLGEAGWLVETTVGGNWPAACTCIDCRPAPRWRRASWCCSDERPLLAICTESWTDVKEAGFR